MTRRTTSEDRERGSRAKYSLFALGGGLALVAIGAMALDFRLVPWWISGEKAEEARAESAFFQPPSLDEIPEGPFGEAILRGRDIFINTPAAANAGDYVGNGLSCSNCHMDEGREALSAPMWAAYTRYPMYRKKNDQINTMEDRVMGCFTFSMNAQHSVAGGPPPHGSDIYRDLESYFYWLATDAPTGEQMKGTGFGKVEPTALGYDFDRGEAVFKANCAVCHGADGAGQTDANGRIVFPALWGEASYNWGAGMARIDTAAAFIKRNMPLSQQGRLTDQDAWDVAAYINSFERPKDPRQGDASIEDNRQRFHNGDKIYYGQEVRGVLLGQGTPEPERPVGAPELPIGPTPLE